jgi:hypothetical protein
MNLGRPEYGRIFDEVVPQRDEIAASSLHDGIMLLPKASSLSCETMRPRRPSRKGLENPPQAFNCFLNAVIQSLWHLEHFRVLFATWDEEDATWPPRKRRSSISSEGTNPIHLLNRNPSFMALHQGQCRGTASLEQKTMPTCVYCALRWIFERFQYDHEAHSLPSDGMRVVLAVLGERTKRFQLRCMEDAAECFEMIMEQLHEDVCGAATTQASMCSHAHCPAHIVFGYEVFDEHHCKCHVPKSTEKIYSSCIYYISTSKGLMTHPNRRSFRETTLSSSSKWERFFSASTYLLNGRQFWGFLRRKSPKKTKMIFEKTVMAQHQQSTELFFGCNTLCRKVNCVRRVLVRSPKVFVISLVWDHIDGGGKDIETVWNQLSPHVDLRHIFVVATPDSTEMSLKSVICYYYLHYVSYCFSASSSTWLMFDDDKVCEIGKSFQDLVDHCVKKKERPYLLFYASHQPLNPSSLHKAPLSYEDWKVLEQQQQLRHVLSQVSIGNVSSLI